MAVKKTAEISTEVEKTLTAESQEAGAESQETGAESQETKIGSAWDETVDVVVPRKPKGEDQSWFICVNDRRFAVPANGKKQTLPRPVAEILNMSVEAEIEAEEFAEEMTRKARGG